LINKANEPVNVDSKGGKYCATGADLERFEKLEQIHKDWLSPTEIAYITASKNAHQQREERQVAKIRGRKIFISYCHRDKEYLERLLVHLKPLEREGLIDPWVDTRLKAGEHWKKEIEVALQQASVAIILVSADSLASDFVVRNELPPILAKAKEDGTLVIPIVVKPCRFGRDPHLSQFHSHNAPDRPLQSISDWERESIFDSLAQRLEEAVRMK
jgi:TIR domain